LLDGLFEHPEVILASAPYGKFQPCFWHQLRFSAACYALEVKEAVWIRRPSTISYHSKTLDHDELLTIQSSDHRQHHTAEKLPLPYVQDGLAVYGPVPIA